RFIAFIPAPVITGFTSGIALIIFIGQIDNLLGVKTEGSESALLKLFGYFQGGFTPDWRTIVLGLVVIATMLFWPKQWNARFPASLLGIILATALNTILGWPVPQIGEIPQTLLLADRLNPFALPWDQLTEFITPALTIAALGAVESLLCGAVASNMTGVRLQGNQELGLFEGEFCETRIDIGENFARSFEPPQFFRIRGACRKFSLADAVCRRVVKGGNICGIRFQDDREILHAQGIVAGIIQPGSAVDAQLQVVGFADKRRVGLQDSLARVFILESHRDIDVAILAGLRRREQAAGNEPPGFEDFSVNGVRPTAESFECFVETGTRNSGVKPESALVEMTQGIIGSLVEEADRCKGTFEAFKSDSGILHTDFIGSLRRRLAEIREGPLGVADGKLRVRAIQLEREIAFPGEQGIQCDNFPFSFPRLLQILRKHQTGCPVLWSRCEPRPQDFHRIRQFLIPFAGHFGMGPRNESRIWRGNLSKGLKCHVEVGDFQPQSHKFLPGRRVVWMGVEPSAEQFNFGMGVVLHSRQSQLLLQIGSQEGDRVDCGEEGNHQQNPPGGNRKNQRPRSFTQWRSHADSPPGGVKQAKLSRCKFHDDGASGLVKVESPGRVEVDILKADFFRIREIRIVDETTLRAGVVAVIGNPNRAAGCAGDVAIDVSREPGGIEGGAGTEVGVGGAGIGPGVEEIDCPLAAAAAQKDRLHLLVVNGQRFDGGVGDLDVPTANGEDAEAARVLEPEFALVVGCGSPIEARSLPFHLHSAKFTPVSAAHEFVHAEGGVVAGFVGGEVRDGHKERAAVADECEQRGVLFFRTGVPPDKKQGAVVSRQESGVHVVHGKARDVHLAIRRAGEEEIVPLAKHGRARVKHLCGDVPAALRLAREPERVLFREIVHPRHGVVRAKLRLAEIEVALDEGDGGFRLTGGGSVRFDEIVEVGDFPAILFCDGRVVVDFVVGLAGLRDKRRDVVRVALGDRTAELHARRLEHRRILDQLRFQIPAPAFVEHDLAAGQIFLKHRRPQERKLVRTRIRDPGIVFVGQMRTPERQSILTHQTARERRGEVQVLERVVFGHRNVRPGGHFVVEIKV
ncbi:MAG: SulP family inorganic anion transporter, partial [Chthoniobacterales bacterium]|nr:SulP family inorganic anion transporter [Chthoniobacterales bacterium]